MNRLFLNIFADKDIVFTSLPVKDSLFYRKNIIAKYAIIFSVYKLV